MSVQAIDYNVKPNESLKPGAYTRIERAIAETGILNRNELLETILDDLSHDFGESEQAEAAAQKYGFDSAQAILECLDTFMIRCSARDVISVKERKQL